MNSGLETGNAADAGVPFRGWFVGDIAAWTAGAGDEAATPRDTQQLEVKWYVHPPGDARESWTAFDDRWSLSIVIDGDLVIDFVDREGARRQVTLAARGDYALWDGSRYAHTWQSRTGATVLTVRWRDAAPAG
jgi:hypothetical protein